MRAAFKGIKQIVGELVVEAGEVNTAPQRPNQGTGRPRCNWHKPSHRRALATDNDVLARLDSGQEA